MSIAPHGTRQAPKFHPDTKKSSYSLGEASTALGALHRAGKSNGRTRDSVVQHQLKYSAHHLDLMSSDGDEQTGYSAQELFREKLKSEVHGFLGKAHIELLAESGKLFLEEGESKEDPYIKKSIQGAMYDMRLGSEVYVSSEKYPRNLKEGNDSIQLAPGEFALLTTYETVHIPSDLIGFISMRFGIKRKGLINISGFHVDPRYKGKLIYSVQNGGPNPVILRYRDPVFILVLASLSTESDKPMKGYINIPADYIQPISGRPVSLVSLNRRVERLEDTIRLLIAILTTVVAAVIAFVVTGR